jgi:hypothetical protein
VTWPAATAHPPHVEVLVINIVAASGDQDIPDDAVVLGLTTPAGFTKHASLNGKFLRAPSSGGDSDLTGAGSATHTHTETAAHTHTPAAHTHDSVTAGTSSFTHDVDSGSPGLSRLSAHHTIALQSQPTTISSDSITSDAGSSEPAYIELLPLQNTSGGDLAPVEDSTIIAFVGAHGTIPSGWELYAPADSLQVKCTTTDIVGAPSTGGSNSHTHSSDHGHTHSGTHTHSETVTTTTSAQLDSGLTDVIALTKKVAEHAHVWNIDGTTPTLQNDSVPLDSQPGRPPYRTVLWIRKVAPTKRVTLGTLHKTQKVVLAG